MIGNRRTRTDRSVTVTSAPLMIASSILAQMTCSSVVSPVASRPSFRIRRWPALTFDCEEGVEICIECDADAPLGSGLTQDIGIIGTAHADFGDVNHVPSMLPQQRSARAGQALIEQ
jgi:hypothetical protein